MILAFSLADLIRVPFGWLMDILYRFTANYGVAMILFAILVKLVLLPITAKSKRSSMKMSRMSPRVKEIQAKYANDPQKQNEAMRALYQEEGVSLFGGCLWALVPLFILLPLYTVVREPIIYMLHETAETATQIISAMKNVAADLFKSGAYYEQMIAAANISDYAGEVQAVLPELSQRTLEGINFDFLGIDLGTIPSFNIFSWEKYDWAHIGAFLLPLLSAGSQVLSMFISMRMNNSVVTNEKGIYDAEAAKQSQNNQTSKTMMWVMPLMSLWIGFSIPAALSLYWLIQGIVSLVMDTLMTKHYRKVYDAEDALRLERAMEQERIEAEKERIRAERRAANPDGITDNTSKKKLQQKQRSQEAAAKAAAAKEYAAKKGIAWEEEPQKEVLSGIPDRPFAKGRAYDPNRYRNTTEE